MRQEDFEEGRALIRRLKEQDEKALEELVKACESYITQIVQNIAKSVLSKEDIQEIVNDAFYQVWKNAQNLDEEKGSAQAYLVATARNLTKNRLRNYQGGVFLIQDYDLAEMEDAFDILEREEKRRIIQEALSRLPAEEKEIFLRYYYLYETTEEIANHLGINRNTVKSKLKRGRKKLRAFLMERRIEL